MKQKRGTPKPKAKAKGKLNPGLLAHMAKMKAAKAAASNHSAPKPPQKRGTPKPKAKAKGKLNPGLAAHMAKLKAAKQSHKHTAAQQAKPSHKPKHHTTSTGHRFW